jgi:hypothetical protein
LPDSSSFSENKQRRRIRAASSSGWNNRLFVIGASAWTTTRRSEPNFDAIVYPKLSASYVMSEEPRFRRCSTGSTSTTCAFAVRGAKRSRTGAVLGGADLHVSRAPPIGATVVGGLRTSSIGNPESQAEKGSEYELGFESDRFARRIRRGLHVLPTRR